MFSAARIAPIAYSDPWGAGFDQRLAALTTRPRHVAYFYELPDTSTFRYRIFNMVQALAAIPKGETSAAWFHRTDLGQMDRFVDRADALVICRTRYTPEIGKMVLRAKARGIPVLFDVDDLVFDPDYTHLVLDTLDQCAADEAVLDIWFAGFARRGALLRMCDAALVTNPFLAERVKEFAPHVRPHVVPNFLNAEQQSLSARLFEAKRDSGFRPGDEIHIGYFSGTPTHNRDFDIASRALARVLGDDPRIVLRVVGFLEPHGPLARHRHRLELHPLQDFLNLQRLIAEVEINIAPLQHNLFTNCKSELKYFEAAIVGSVTVASPSYTFARAISDGSNGFLAASYEWEAKLHAALDTVREPGRYAEMAMCGFRHAEREYGWDRHGRAIENVLFGAGQKSDAMTLAQPSSGHPAAETAEFRRTATG